MSRAQAVTRALEHGRKIAERLIANELETEMALEYVDLHESVLGWKRQRIKLPHPDDPRLSPRESAVVALAMDSSMSDRGIGKRLGIKTGTVKIHLKNARLKGRP